MSTVVILLLRPQQVTVILSFHRNACTRRGGGDPCTRPNHMQLYRQCNLILYKMPKLCTLLLLLGKATETDTYLC